VKVALCAVFAGLVRRLSRRRAGLRSMGWAVMNAVFRTRGWPHFRGPPRPWKPARSPSDVRPARR